ncbi:MAG: CAP domain-containing protein [Minisyncoccia bacterium]
MNKRKLLIIASVFFAVFLVLFLSYLVFSKPIKESICKEFYPSLDNKLQNYYLSNASSTVYEKTPANFVAIENINKIYPKTIANNPTTSYTSSKVGISATASVDIVLSGGISDSDIIILTNIERQKIGIKSLKENNLLNKIAQERLEDMFSQGYFEHVSPQGTSVSDVANTNGYSYLLIGENIALGNFKSSTDLVTAWMESTGHRENILKSSFLETGVYARKGSYNDANMIMAVQVFANPSSSCPYPDSNLKTKISGEISQVNDLSAIGKVYMADIKTMESDSDIDFTAYNNKVYEYNNLVKKIDDLYADIKNITDRYNSLVRAYNSCISLFK